MDDEIPYSLTRDQWSALSDDRRLILMTADSDQAVPDWVKESAQRILNDLR